MTQGYLGVPWLVWGAFIAAGTALVTLAVNAFFSTRKDRREAAASIALHRVEWIEKLRSSVADYCGLAIAISTEKSRTEERQLEMARLVSYIILLLNPAEHQTLHDLLRNFVTETEDRKKYSIDEVVKLRNAARAVLKAEWEVAKAETLGKSKALDETRKKIASIVLTTFGFSIEIRRAAPHG